MRIDIDMYALTDALQAVEEDEGIVIPGAAAAYLVARYIELLRSDDRNFSDEMLARKSRFEALKFEYPNECPTKLWEDSDLPTIP